MSELEWRERSQHEAIDMADRIRMDFAASLNRGSRLLPLQSEELRQELFNTFLDGLIGSIVMIGTQWTTDMSPAFEEAIITNFKHKFTERRRIQLSTNREMGHAPLKVAEGPDESGTIN